MDGEQTKVKECGPYLKVRLRQEMGSYHESDYDDLQWARRCARAATLLLGKKPRTGLRR